MLPPCSLNFVLLALTAVFGLGVDPPPEAGAPRIIERQRASAAPDIILIVADDIGIGRVGAYDAHPRPGYTPNLDRLAAAGVLFTNAWANSLCTPTRATILTGRYCFRTGAGRVLFEGNNNVGQGLKNAESLIPEALGQGYASLAFGKWHVAKSNQLPEHPLQNGFLAFRGSHFNLQHQSYYRKTWFEDLTPRVSYRYATTLTTDDAIQVPQAFAGPRFLYVAYHAPHTPFEAPPSHLHRFSLQGLDPGAPENGPIFQRAMIEAMDTEIGRLIAAYPNAVFIFVGDNGDARPAVDAPFDPNHAKGTLYQGGIQVPLIISEPGGMPRHVTHRGRVDSLVNTTDLFATVVELGGGTSVAEDSISLLPYLQGQLAPRRKYAYAEEFKRITSAGAYVDHQRAIRNSRYKLIRIEELGQPTVEELYDLNDDPLELDDLIASGVPQNWISVYRELRLALDSL